MIYLKLKRIYYRISSLVKYIENIHSIVGSDYKSSKCNLGRIQAFHNSVRKIEIISETEFQVFSQFGDDGIIQWLIGKLPIRSRTFVEFGVENYRESNTRFLLINNFWSGLVIEGDPACVEQIRSDQISTFFDLQSECCFITTDNINQLIDSARFERQIGLLSIDVDGNDYWIWNSINSIEPVIVIIEYNGLFGFEHAYTIPYSPTFRRGVETPFNFYGTSLLSACDLASEKGYNFIGCNSAGNNAYFIKDSFVHHLNLPPVSVQSGYVFPSFSETWNPDGIPRRGMEKVRSLNGLVVYNTRLKQEEVLDSESIIDSLLKSGKSTRR